MPPPSLRSMRRSLKSHQHAIFVFSVILTVTLVLLIPNARLFLWEAYAYRRVSVKSWSQPWKSLPFEEGLWKGVKDLASSASSTRKTDGLVCSSTQLPGRKQGEEEEGVVLCDEIDGVEFPVCGFGGVEAVGGCLGRFPNPPLGSFGIYPSERIGCATRVSRWQAYDSTNPNISWSEVDFADVQDQCIRRNMHRNEPDPIRGVSRIQRTAIVLRAWDGFQWTEDDLRNIRAMLTELVLFTGGQYQLFILLHIRDPLEAIPGPEETIDDVKRRHVPEELVHVTEIWNYTDCEMAYPRVGEWDVYYHTFMPLQLIAKRHAEFDFYWNWEMDVRFTGHYHSLLSSLASWARQQPMEGLWERNARFHIDAVHGSPAASKSNENGEADLITLFPLFDISNTLWPHRNYLINYPSPSASVPRLGTVNTNMRFSARLLSLMHKENQDLGRSMMSEMWPPTLALHNGLKAVYVPHPVYLDRVWPVDVLQRTFNAGPGGQVGGSLETVINQEDDLRGSTWFWDATFPERVYERWMGLAVGSDEWEVEHGEMCLPPVLLHPVKSDRLSM